MLRLIAVLALSCITTATSVAEESKADVAQITALLTRIYSHYLVPFCPQLCPKGRLKDPACYAECLRRIEANNPIRVSNAPTFFDPEMVALLDEEHRLATGPDGGIVAFDYDPICDCQDQEGLRSTIGAVKIQTPTRATANVSLQWVCTLPPPSPRISAAQRRELLAGCRREHPHGIIEAKQLVFTFVPVNGEWRIHDIHAPGHPSLKQHVAGSIASTRKALQSHPNR